MNPYYFYAQGLCVGYSGVPLIKNIKFHAEKGEILTLIGPNGAGKSTILKSIAGQLSLMGGTIFLEQKDFFQTDKNERAKKMAAVFTEKLYTEMATCWDIAAFGRYPYTGRFGLLSKQDEQVTEEAMKLVKVWELKDQEFRKISDGQRQRVLLARAICQKPEIILLDEPTSYLDVRYKLEFMNTLQELTRKKKLAVIMSLHELDLAEKISDKLLCVKEHHIEKFGSPEEVFIPGYIQELFELTLGSFDALSTGAEMNPPSGKPEVFVIAGGGRGRAVFHRLQREGRAFAAGILFENDLDYPVAKALAAYVVKAEAFEPIKKEQVKEAIQWIDQCQEVICCREKFGSWESENSELFAYAKEQGKRITCT